MPIGTELWMAEKQIKLESGKGHDLNSDRKTHTHWGKIILHC